MKHSGKYSIVNFMLLIFIMIIIGCGSSSEVIDNSSNSNDSSITICENVEGTWWITDTIDASDCGEDTQYDSYQATIDQSDCNLTVAIGRDSFSGIINGSAVSWSGSYATDSGTITINSMVLNKSDNKLSGSSNWTLSDGQETCTGSTGMSATRI
jgi:hypothetical protein